MQIVIPMSGVGKRFLDAGYLDPKPLIRVDGRPIIEHVVQLFPGETRFLFICNEDHLNSTPIREVLQRIAPQGRILSIPSHKKGPVFAVSQVFSAINDDDEVIVNYCDFGKFWDFTDFLRHTRARRAAGAISAYRGFHPHMLGTTNYAFLRDHEQWMLEIREKQPFTNRRMDEFASDGTYYFQSGRLMKKYFRETMEAGLEVNGEYYVSVVYNLLVRDKLPVSIYKIQHMLQWGTPQDLEEYQNWSAFFSRIAQPLLSSQPQPGQINLIPMAGRGVRFSDAGYKTPKPLLPVSGRPMIVQAASALPPGDVSIFVCLLDHLQQNPHLKDTLQECDSNVRIVPLSQVTEGQAVTCNIGLQDISDESSLVIGACDNGMLYSRAAWKQFIAEEKPDAVLFTFKNHPSSRLHPQMYGWVETNGCQATRVSVKIPVSNHVDNDHAVVGAFWFSKMGIFRKGLARLLENKIRVNGEFYVDSLMQMLIELGFSVKVFLVDHYVCWGTPGDYETFCYWQSFFHKCAWHPYDLSNDPMIPDDERAALEESALTFSQEYE